MSGRIHSLESFGTVDGRCAFCRIRTGDVPCAVLTVIIRIHREMQAGTVMEADEIIAQYERNISFYKGGGITVTGENL